MWKNIIITLSIFCFVSHSEKAKSQCIGGTNAGAISPAAGWQTVANVAGGTYYTFNATAGNVYYFSFCGSGGGSFYDTEITILNNFGNPVQYGFNDDYCGAASYVAWTCLNTATYRVLITKYQCALQTNMGTLAYRGGPPATCPAGLGTGVVNVASLPYTSGSTSTNAQVNDITSDNINYCGSANNYGGLDRVYVFTPATGGTVTINCNNSASRASLSVYEGCPLLGNNSVCVGSSYGNGNRSVVACLKQGVTYYVVVDSRQPTNNFNYTLTISAPVAAGSCVIGTTVPVVSLPYSSTGRTTCGKANDITAANAEPCGNGAYLSGEDEVFVFTPSSSGRITFSLSSSSTNTGMFLIQGCPLTSFCSGTGNVCINSETSTSGNKTMCADVVAGRTYYLIVDSWGGCKPYSIQISTPSSNLTGATCAQPVVIPSLPYAANGENTACMGDDYNNYSVVTCASLFESGEDRVYQYTASQAECISISISDASTNNIGYQVYNGCPGTAGSVCITSGGGAFSGALSGSITLPAAGTYYIIIDTWADPRNTEYNISFNSFTNAVLNDLPCDAIEVSVGASISGDNSCSSGSNEPASASCWTSSNTMNTVWYFFTAPASGSTIVRTLPGSLRNTQIAVYSGVCGSTMSLVACNNDASPCGNMIYNTPTYMSQVSLTGLTPGVKYYIVVDGTAAYTGTFGLMVVDGISALPPVVGQECAVPLPACNDTITVGDPGFQSFGNTCDFPGAGFNCLLTGERGSAWYELPILSNGTLDFSIVPNDWPGSPSTEGTDYDFAIWKISGTGATSCSGIAGGATPLRCNYSELGITGLNGASNNIAPAQYPGFEAAFNAALTVTAGERYVLSISNFSNSISGFTLVFGTAAPIDFAGSPATVYWTGGADNDWFKAANWGGCAIPSCTINAVVLSATANQPSIDAAGAVARSLTIEAGATLTLNTAQTLEVCGDYQNKGTFNARPTSTVIFNGNGTQTVSGVLTGANDFVNVEVNKPSGVVNIADNLDVSGNFSITGATSSCNVQGNYMRLNGNFSNAAGTFTPGLSGSLEFIGTAAQQYTNINELENVILNNSGAGVNLLSDMDISTTGTLQLNLGKIVTNAFEANVLNDASAAVSTGNVSSFVQGFLRRKLPSATSLNRILDFPVGHSATGFQRINLSTFNGSDPAIQSLKVHFSPFVSTLPPAPGQDPSCAIAYNSTALDNGFWTVDPQGSGTAAMHITLYNLSYTNAQSSFTVYRQEGAGAWTIPAITNGGCVSPPVTAVLRNGISQTFNAGTTIQLATAQGTSVLPVSLISLEAEPNITNIICSWSTGSEVNNKGFEVQRAIHPEHFTTIGWVEGKGTVNTLSDYKFVDKDVKANTVYYYRLKQLDFDGQATVSVIVAAVLKDQGVLVLEAFPNPYKEVTSIGYILSRTSMITIEVSDMNGKLVKRYLQGLQSPGQYTMPFSAKSNGWSAGTYMVTVWCDDQRYQLRIAEND